MKDNKENAVEEFMTIFKELPYEIQQIIFWSVKNIKLIKEMCENSEMSLKEINEKIENALKEKDYFTYVLFSFQKLYDEKMRNNYKI
ncbi:hypothetical protein [Anaerofustis stercorihominis]|uniref:Uncharacterized protein n=1 Tax=Anaerofustis stercorihominis TaxID=214853 RepID=A0A3E3DY59_9FIRM|nr:hypothetical protein [Anaerofustis stercorihominis]RGD74173.1 hypothetical protein DW687_05240 [Anaerofustis stercorihominis]